MTKVIIGVLLAITIATAETKWGETRLGFEFTPWSDNDYTAPYNPKFKQKAILDDNKIEFKVFRRHYKYDDGTEYNRLKIWPIVKTKYYLFYEGMFDFYTGDKDQKKYKNILGGWYKFNKYLETRIGYTWKDKINSNNDHTRTNAYIFIFTGNIFHIGKHKLGYENYNYRRTDNNDWDLSLELQYKYRVADDIDLYAYSVNGYEVRPNSTDRHASRLDLGIYWYF